MIWYYGNEKPESVVKKLRYCQKQYTVNFNVEVLEEGPYRYRWQSVTLEPGIWTRGAIISAIIHLRYTDDAMQSVVNNYLDEPRTTDAETDMEEMQRWRKLAKDVATENFDKDEDLPVTRAEAASSQTWEEDTIDELGKIVQTETGTGSPWDPYHWQPGKAVKTGCYYFTPSNYLWQAIKDGVPSSETDEEYFKVIS